MITGGGTGTGAPLSADTGAAPGSGDPVLVAAGLGFPAEGDVAGVTRAILDGQPVTLKAESAWPLPPLPALAPEGAYSIRVTDRAVGPAEREVVLRPPSLVVGVGASKGVPVDEVLGLVEDALRDAGLSAQSVAELATVDTKADEPGILGAAERLGVPVVTYSAEELAKVEVPNPSDAPLTAAGTPSVAEAAALARGGELLVPKRKSAARPAMATCAVVRRAIIGSGDTGVDPATVDMMTVVAVGHTATREIAGRTVTPRGYRRQEEPE